MKIVDAFTFFNEIELLKIRLELLYDHVDAFCICEGRYTFTGIEKPYFIELHQQDLKPWLDKIIYLKFQPDITGVDFSKKDSSFNPTSPAWQMERGQRNALIEVCNQMDASDKLILSDLDELPNPEVITAIRNGHLVSPKARLQMQMHYYYMNCIGVGAENSRWSKAFLSTVDEIKKAPDLEYMRLQDQMPVIANAGWHFSYLGGTDAVSEKINAISHTEVNRPDINNILHLGRCIEMGIDYLGRADHEYAFVPVARYPEGLRRLMLQNPGFIKKSLM